jgi:L-amino acid N-acyltransferase YncA
MIKADIVRDKNDLQQILELQRQNLRHQLTEEEKVAHGFLTMQHSMEVLEAMHELAPSIVIRDEGRIVAYALTELKECRSLVPALEDMFALIDRLDYQGRPIRDQRFYTMGQICIGKAHRGMGLFDLLYRTHRDVYSSRFDLFITEISSSNHRSLRAHQRVGFQTIAIHRDHLDEWQLVLWDWTK